MPIFSEVFQSFRSFRLLPLKTEKPKAIQCDMRTFHFPGADHFAQESEPSYLLPMESPSFREYPMCNCMQSRSISRMGTKINPPPKKKSLGFPTKLKQHSRHPRTFCFINNMRMTTSNCFEYAKNPRVNAILTKKIPESKISNPQKSFNQPRHLKLEAPPPLIAFKIFKRYR